MKKMVTILSVLMVMFSLAGCTAPMSKEAAINELKQKNTTMFTASNTYAGLAPDGDYLHSTSYEIMYDGTVNIKYSFSVSGDTYVSTTISDDDYAEIYFRSVKAAKENDFENYYIDGFDGGIWTITFYDPDTSNPTQLLSGAVARGNETLDTYFSILKKLSDQAQ